MKSFEEKLSFFFRENRSHILGALALILLGYAFYNPAFRFVPVDFDDLVLLSNVKNTHNPFSFFVQDWGFGNYGYRPLHAFSLWVGFQIFGVSSGPNQLINLILHLIVILLLYRFMLKTNGEPALAFIFSSLSLVSLYTFSPPTWVSDRPTLFVGFFLLLFMNNFIKKESKEKNSFLVPVGLSALALMSKESGLIVPIVAGFFLISEKDGFKRNKTTVVLLGLLVLFYIIFRFILFGANAGAYDEAGYLFGFRYYNSAANLPGIQKYLAYIENAIKNGLAVFIPLFDGQGKLSLIGSPANSIILVSTTVILGVISFSKRLTRYQIIGLMIVAINACLHFQIFRYRTLYLAQIGFSIFLATASRFSNTDSSWRATALLLAGVLTLWSVHIIGEDITYLYLDRYNLLQQPGFEQQILETSNRIDPQIVHRIIEKYRH